MSPIVYLFLAVGLLSVLVIWLVVLLQRTVRIGEEAYCAAADFRRRYELAVVELRAIVNGHAVWPDEHWRSAKRFVDKVRPFGSDSE